MSYETPWRSLGDSNPCFRRERASIVTPKTGLQTQHWPFDSGADESWALRYIPETTPASEQPSITQRLRLRKAPDWI